MNLNRTPPKRLKETHRGLQELSERSFSPERLKANQTLIEKNIQAAGSGASLLTKSMVVGLTTITLVTATALWLKPASEEIKPTPEENPGLQQLEPSLAKPVEEAAQSKSPATLKAPAQNLLGDASDTSTNDQVLNEQQPSEEEGKFKSLDKAPIRIAPTKKPETKPRSPNPPKPNLGAEIKSFEQAKAYFENQEFEQAHTTLKRLLKNFDNPKLQVEVKVLLAQTLLGLEQSDQALTVLQNLMQTSNTKPQAQWYKLLGDIQKSRNQCGAALIAYSKAINRGLSQQQRMQVGASVRACSQTQ